MSKEELGNIYMAARFSRKDEIRQYAENIMSCYGCKIVSEWLWENPRFAYLGDVKEFTEKHPDMTMLAHEDLMGVIRCDTFILFTDPIFPGVPRNSKNVEFGVALGQGKRMIAIGPLENLFLHLHRVEWYSDWDKFVEKEFYNG